MGAPAGHRGRAQLLPRQARRHPRRVDAAARRVRRWQDRVHPHPGRGGLPMSWLDELRLRDIDNESIIEATCLSCGHTWKQTPIQLLLKVDHRDVKMARSRQAPRLHALQVPLGRRATQAPAQTPEQRLRRRHAITARRPLLIGSNTASRTIGSGCSRLSRWSTFSDPRGRITQGYPR